MYYVAALGNPGSKYENTRHNVGWTVVSQWLQTAGFPSVVESRQYSGRVSTGMVGESEVTVLLPDTFMNNSGVAVAKLVPKTEASQLIVVYDDIDLPLGEVKVSVGRGAGGHNGVASIIQKMGTKDFVRVRVGIAPKSLISGEVKRPAGGGPLERFVLKPFGLLERSHLPEVYEKAGVAINTIIAAGVEAAMNKIN